MRRIAGQWHYLLLCAYDYWDFPKGQVEAGEDPLAAAIRETEEETTRTGLNFRWGHVVVETEPYGKNKIARYYIAESKAGGVGLPVSAELGHPDGQPAVAEVRPEDLGLDHERGGEAAIVR